MMTGDTVAKVNKYLLRIDKPVTSAANISRELGLSKKEVLNVLRLLEYNGEVASKQVGANAIAWYHIDRVVSTPPQDQAENQE